MAAPFKRVCQHAVRQSSQVCRRRTGADASQWRPFSTTNTRRAAPSQEANPYVRAFPDSETNPSEDPDFAVDELSAIAHEELAQHRELRTLLRTAAWEMPLLSALAQPYTPPDRSAQPLRWRYTTYMGEMHPAARKVVVEFKPTDLNLTDAQTLKLLKLVGPRYNPDKKLVKMSCEDFETPAMNKRHLAETIKALIAEATNGQSDHFAGIPLDTRHHKSKSRPKFPEEWLLTVERKQELEEGRRQRLLEEGRRVEGDLVVNGLKAIEDARQLALKEAAAAPTKVAHAQQSLGQGRTPQRGGPVPGRGGVAPARRGLRK